MYNIQDTNIQYIIIKEELSKFISIEIVIKPNKFSHWQVCLQNCRNRPLPQGIFLFDCVQFYPKTTLVDITLHMLKFPNNDGRMSTLPSGDIMRIHNWAKFIATLKSLSITITSRAHISSQTISTHVWYSHNKNTSWNFYKIALPTQILFHLHLCFIWLINT